MSTHAVKKIDEMEGIYGGAFKRARAELGVESFGMQIIDMPPNYDGYPEHDHSEDGQEEVYFTLRGAGEIEIEGERYPLDEDHVAKVGPGIKRKVWPGDDGIRILVLGGKVGEAYEAPDITKLGEPDPMAGRASSSFIQRREAPLTAPRSRACLVAGAGGHRKARVARIGGVLARALAEREDRAARVGDQPLVAAAVAEAARRPARLSPRCRAGRHRRTPRQGAEVDLCATGDRTVLGEQRSRAS